MPLKVKDGMGAWIDDFKKSDAPQFKGKSDKERRDQAIAAYLSAKRDGKSQKENGDLSYEGPKKIPASIVKKLKSLNLKVDQDDDDDDMKKEEIERRADFEITKKVTPDGSTKFVKKPRKEIEIGKGKMEANQKQDGPPWDGPSKKVKGPTDFHAMRAKVKSLAVKGMNQAGKKPGVKKNG